MNKIWQKYITLLKTYPIFRFISLLAIVLIISGFISVITSHSQRKPEVKDISPLIGSPGDEMIIKGNRFGNSKNNSYVEIDGSRVTSSNFLSWSNNEIRLILPSNVDDGLIIVATNAGKSEPKFFSNIENIPVAVRNDKLTSFPNITSVYPQNPSIGDTIIISGNNFGSHRGNSLVYFTANKVKTDETFDATNSTNYIEDYITAKNSDFDYEFWSDSEIRVRVPDGADSGIIYVSTDKGESSAQKINIKFPAGKKQLSTPRTYVIETKTEIVNNNTRQESDLMVFMPKPPVSAFQPNSIINASEPEPFISDDPKQMIYKTELSKLGHSKLAFSQLYVVTTYSVKSSIYSKGVLPYQDTDSTLYKTYTKADGMIPSNEKAVRDLANTIVGRERFPYEKVKLIYNYMLKNFTLDTEYNDENFTINDMINEKHGDSYMWTVLFTALCRSSEVPAIPISGVLVEDINVSKIHWWTEIFFEEYGFFPVDISLAAGMEFNSFTEITDPKVFYFGNLDNQHVAFSRGYNQIKPTLTNSNTIYRDRGYALQSSWEEVSNRYASYTTVWNDPMVSGIY